MRGQNNSVRRLGRIYHFSANGTDYAAFIWRHGSMFRGRVEANPQVPLSDGSSPQAVCAALQRWLINQPNA